MFVFYFLFFYCKIFDISKIYAIFAKYNNKNFIYEKQDFENYVGHGAGKRWHFVYQEKHVEAVSDLAFSEVEALSHCEITRKGKIILECDGDGSCSDTYLGYTLKCDGKRLSNSFRKKVCPNKLKGAYLNKRII